MSNIALLVWGLSSLVLCVLFIAASVINLYNDVLRIVFMCLGVGFFLSLFAFAIVATKWKNTPENKHERLLNDLDRAEKNLQKFYIDHPEFKEEQE